MPDPIATLNSVSLPGGFNGSPRRLDAVSLQISTGFTALIGPSGAGKTSLLNLLAGFELPSSGSASLPPTIGWAPAGGALWPHLNARDHLSACSPQDTELPNILLEAFALTHLATSKPGELSEGERDRLTIARAIANSQNSPARSLLVLDEPLVHIDPARKRQFWDAIRSHTSCPVIFSSHDPSDAIAEADRVLCLSSGSVVFDGDVLTLYHHPPTADLAAFLGPGNWFSSFKEMEPWIIHPPHESSAPICLRPEHLKITPDPDSPHEVASARFCGSHEEVTVTAQSEVLPQNLAPSTTAPLPKA